MNALLILNDPHITNTMAVAGKDFAKGQANGAHAGLAIARAAANVIRPPRQD